MENKFLTNYTKESFLDSIKKSLNECIEFKFCVSFIKYAGLSLLKKDIENALDRGVKGTIITSTYQNFTDTASLNYFLDLMKKYTNFTCHIDFNCFGDDGFHTKGYLFKYQNSYSFFVGSSNITSFALLKNVEWDVLLKSNNLFNSYSDALTEFNNLYNKTLKLDEEIIKEYNEQLNYAIEIWDMDQKNPNLLDVRPNSMQRRALKELQRNRDLGVKRSLVISATGSGKTYLAAFDARNFNAKKLLFIVHRDTILVDALNTFQKVFGGSRTYKIYEGKEEDLDYDFIFSTNIMMSGHLSEFDKTMFDYIVLDECHHATTNTYKSILDYFRADFVLGLTATPERMDNEDVFSLFDNNVPFELRLRDAIINDLIVPFHYYAIKDDYIDYSSSDKAKISNQISKEINVEFIKSEIEKHKKENEKLKCIAFCASIEHAIRMAYVLNNVGYSTTYLTGSNSTGERLKAFKELQDESSELEIICCVDILNEGVDIPSINMVLFLRPTESSTIFLQQLGRGLRKYKNKDYLTVLDFIGNNYDRSTQIALALGTLGQSAYTEKKYLKDLINTDFKSLGIPGVEIFFDPLSKTEILRQIDKTNFNLRKYLESDYYNFKNYLNKDKIPTHMDYLNYSSISPDLIRFLKSKLGKQNKSYYSFLKNIGEEEIPIFSEKNIKFLDNLSLYLPLVRVDEYLIINQILNENNLNIDNLVGFNKNVTKETLENALYQLRKDNILIDNKLNISDISKEFRSYLLDLLNYGLSRYEQDFSEFSGLFKLYHNYYKEQTRMVLNEKGLMFVKGTDFRKNGETICYVCLKKDESTEQRLLYKDKFLNSQIFEWESETNVTLDNAYGKKILNTKKVHLFIRKVESEDGITMPFTYFGTGKFKNIRESYTMSKDKKINTLLCDIILDQKVDEKFFLDFEIEE